MLLVVKGVRSGGVIAFETVCRMDAAAEPPGMGLRRVSNAITLPPPSAYFTTKLHQANFLSLQFAKCVKWYNGINSLVSIIRMSADFSTVSQDSALLKQVVATGDVLRRRNWHVSCAESCTGGGIAYVLTSVSGSSDWFNQSWVTYSNEAKQSLIGVKTETLAEFGAVSEQTVAEMVQGVVQESGAQVGVSVSGIAGPGGGSAEKPVGTVWFGFIIDGELNTQRHVFSGDRLAVREQAVVHAISYLYQRLVAE